MGFQVSPGVNVSEIDLTTIVPAVSTTEAGFAAHLSVPFTLKDPPPKSYI